MRCSVFSFAITTLATLLALAPTGCAGAEDAEGAAEYAVESNAAKAAEPSGPGEAAGAQETGEPAEDSTPAGAAKAAGQKGTILALGDSITFGWDPVLASKGKVNAADHAGYAEVLGKSRGVPVDNAACPGETAGSFLSAKAIDNGCRGNRAAFGTHRPWTIGGKTFDTQMAFAEAYLAQSKPALITVTLGGNDLYVLQKFTCKENPVCVAVGLLGAINEYGDNLTKIFARIAGTGYRGKVAMLTQYSPDYGNPVNDIAIGGLALKIRDFVKDEQKRHPQLGVVVADAYASFEEKAGGGDSCKAGLLIPNGDGKTCDIHPSPKGDALLAAVVTGAVSR